MKSSFSFTSCAMLIFALSASARASSETCPTNVNRYDEKGGYITITTTSMVKNDKNQCSMTDAFQIINDGGNFGTNTCGSNIQPSPDWMVTINGRGLTYSPQSEIFLSKNGARVYNATFDGTGTTRIFRVTTPDAYLVLDTVSIVDGKAGSQGGGGVLVESGGRLAVYNGRFQENHAGTGGAIMHQSYSELIIYHTYFQGNTAEQGVGGAVRLSASDNAFIMNSRFQGNKASLAGGAIYMEGAALDITNSYLEGNEAASDGGGIHSAGYIYMGCTRVVGNTAASGDGGGVFIAPASGEATIVESVIEKNKAGGNLFGHGGGLFVGDDTTVRNGSVSYNSAEVGGGGIYIHDSAADDPIRIENMSIIGNEVIDGSGGGLHVTGWGAAQPVDDPESPLGKNYSFRILNSTIAGNKSNDAQLYIDDAGYKTYGEILFHNNAVDTFGEGNGNGTCGGLVERLLTQLPGDPDPAATYNAQWPDTACGSGFDVLAVLGNLTSGGRFDQAYAPTTGAKAGFAPACIAVEDVDQFMRAAPCRLGSVRAGAAPSTPDPQAPGPIF